MICVIAAGLGATMSAVPEAGVASTFHFQVYEDRDPDGLGTVERILWKAPLASLKPIFNVWTVCPGKGVDRKN